MLAFNRHRNMIKLIYYSNPNSQKNQDLNKMLTLIEELKTQYSRHPLYQYIEASRLLEQSRLPFYSEICELYDFKILPDDFSKTFFNMELPTTQVQALTYVFAVAEMQRLELTALLPPDSLKVIPSIEV